MGRNAGTKVLNGLLSTDYLEMLVSAVLLSLSCYHSKPQYFNFDGETPAAAGSASGHVSLPKNC
jgi:hypothetical protein